MKLKKILKYEKRKIKQITTKKKINKKLPWNRKTKLKQKTKIKKKKGRQTGQKSKRTNKKEKIKL